MTSHGARTARLLLASISCLLLLAGLSCKYDVTLPWVFADASQRTPDVSFDLASSPDLPLSSPDSPLPGQDARGCPNGRYKTWNATRAFAQILVAIDRSTSMQKDFDSGTKTQAALLALNYLVERHPAISFSTIWFPWNNCAGPGCCASPVFTTTSKAGPPDASGGCGPNDAGCLPPSPDSPAHQALRRAYSYLNTRYFQPWNSTVILITDQNPSCANESPSDESACVAAANEADELGSDLTVRTFVMVPTDERAPPDCLPWIATRNADNFSDAEQLMTAKNALEMREKLDEIATGIDEKLCLFYLQQMDGPIDSVEIDGTTIVRDESGKTGWKVSYGAILLSPEECAKTAKLTNPEVKVITCRSSGGSGGS